MNSTLTHNRLASLYGGRSIPCISGIPLFRDRRSPHLSIWTPAVVARYPREAVVFSVWSHHSSLLLLMRTGGKVFKPCPTEWILIRDCLAVVHSVPCAQHLGPFVSVQHLRPVRESTNGCLRRVVRCTDITQSHNEVTLVYVSLSGHTRKRITHSLPPPMKPQVHRDRS